MPVVRNLAQLRSPPRVQTQREGPGLFPDADGTSRDGRAFVLADKSLVGFRFRGSLLYICVVERSSVRDSVFVHFNHFLSPPS
jgi:hypothetical protein